MTRRPWTPSEHRCVMRLYANAPTADIADRLGRTVSEIRNFARLIGIERAAMYRRLEAGEIICEGDEIDCCRDQWRDAPVWRPVTACIGEPAPDPQYVSHRQYRRKAASAAKESLPK
mgnify:CR=1 FL=1